MENMKVNFLRLLAAKQNQENDIITVQAVADATGIDRRKLYTLRDLSQESKLDDQKFPLTLGESAKLCDYLGCRYGELVEYVPELPLAQGQQMPHMRQSALVPMGA